MSKKSNISLAIKTSRYLDHKKRGGLFVQLICQIIDQSSELIET